MKKWLPTKEELGMFLELGSILLFIYLLSIVL